MYVRYNFVQLLAIARILQARGSQNGTGMTAAIKNNASESVIVRFPT
jgi:hypothetical protein